MRTHLIAFLLALFCLGAALPAGVQDRGGALPLRGINLAGGDFAPQVLPGKNGTEYGFPPMQDVETYADFGMQVFRLSFLWERIQPNLYGPLDASQMKLVDQVVQAATARHVLVILDVHNYGKYRGRLIGSAEVPNAAFDDLWVKLAKAYKDNAFVAFGLMNEPYKHKADAWAKIAQEAVWAIRKTGARQTILVPGTNFSAAHRWLTKDGELSNGEALRGLKDPANNFAFEAHVYFDKDSSGTHPDCVSETIGPERLSPFTGWLRENDLRGFLGEFGSSTDATCLKNLENTLDYMDANKDVWMGWTLWAASRRFGKYMFNIYPPDPDKFPQARILRRFIDVQQEGLSK